MLPIGIMALLDDLQRVSHLAGILKNQPLELQVKEVSEGHTLTWLPELLHFVSTLLWQAVVVGILYFYRHEVKGLLLRVTGLKIGVAEITAPIQQPSTSAIKVEESSEAQSERDADGFYTRIGIKQLIQDTSPVDEAVVDALLLFKTSKQHTWLVATQAKLYCVLDDAERRKTGELVQWDLPLEKAEPISVKSSDNPAYGFLDINSQTYWYYSLDLFPAPEALKSAISELIRKAKGAPPPERLPIPR
jgi:hypothetical protein